MSVTLRSDSGAHAGVITDAGLGLASTTDSEGNSVAVTAVADSDSKLKLIAWRVPPTGNSVTRIGDSGTQAGQCDLVDMAASTGDRFIAGVRTTDGNLRLIAWQVKTSDGSIQRLTDSANRIGAVSLISMCPSPEGNGNVVVAFRNEHGNLMVENWGFDSSGKLQRHGDVTAGAISAVAVGDMSGSRVWTAVRDSNGNLKVIIWQITPGGGLVRKGDSGTHAGAISEVSGAALGDFLVTAVRDGGSNLLLISWQISSDGSTVTRVADSGHAAGGADNISCAALLLNDKGRIGKIFTALRTREFTLKIIGWQISSSGGIQRVEDFPDRAGTVDKIRFVAAQGVWLTAIRQASDQRLKVVAWHIFDAGVEQKMADNMIVTKSGNWENTSQAIAPSSAVPNGAIVTNIGQPRGTGFDWRDLVDSSSAFSLNAPTTTVPYPFAAGQASATDNQLLLLQDGSLLGIKAGYISSDLPSPPAWFNTCAISGQTSQQARNAIFAFRSTDAGKNWSLLSVIDAAVVSGGDFGWPQGDGSHAGNGSGGVGGFDRCEAYQDPFTGRIYVSGGGDGGPYKKSDGTVVSKHAGVVFVSTDNGVTWSEQARFPNQGKGGAPYVMTSTPNHPLVVFNLWNGPTLYHLDKNASKLSAGQDVTLNVDGTSFGVQGDAGIGDLRGAPACVARVGAQGNRDEVWVAYPTLNDHSHQIYKVCLVTFDSSGSSGNPPSVQEVVTIQAQDPVNRCVALGQFVQDVLPSPPSGNPANFTLFYWVDAPPSTAADPNHLVVRGKLLCNRVGHYQVTDLSVAGGATRSFNRFAMGDYFKGGAFVWNSDLNFLAQWVEQDAAKGNILSVPQGPGN
jgi:hypothetical protein